MTGELRVGVLVLLLLLVVGSGIIGRVRLSVLSLRLMGSTDYSNSEEKGAHCWHRRVIQSCRFPTSALVVCV
ncbi:hypothetical protein EV361DRAFT_36263 [Lentinula raphanica]|nr:hypothetical protein EV361DRAFT_36263 [Lentinula raphanica]